jgi:SPP1 family predicted phage head-tail adaptor
MNVGALRHLVSLSNPGPPVPDGSGGFTETPVPLSPPTTYAEIKPATARDLERVTAGTVTSTASHVVRMRYHSGITTETRITFGTREFEVSGIANTEERNVELVLLCTEVIA